MDSLGAHQNCLFGIGGAFSDQVLTTAERRQEASLNMRGAQEGRSIAARSMSLMRKCSWISKLGELGKDPFFKALGRASLVLGFGTAVGMYVDDGEDGATAVVKATVETVSGLALGSLGVALGGLCGPAVVICSPAFGAAGGIAGGWFGAKVNSWLSDGDISGWKPYEATDNWFDWD
jgi:hypothetical protein